jgi:hypothetical protein
VCVEMRGDVAGGSEGAVVIGTFESRRVGDGGR